MADGVAALVMADIHSSTPDIDWTKLAGELHSAIAAREMAADPCEASNFTEDDEWALEQPHTRLWDLIENISAHPALSFEGLRVKARAVSVAMDGDLDGDATDVRLLRSLLADLAQPAH